MERNHDGRPIAGLGGAESRCQWETLIVGNGLSINIWSDFAYSRLFEPASLSLNPSACTLFSDFKTQNFETVLEALWHAETTLRDMP